MVLLSTHTHARLHSRHTEVHTQLCSTLLFSWLSCMAGSFLTENRADCLRKVQLPQLRRSGTLPPFTSLPAAPSFPSAFLTLSPPLTHSVTCESRWTHVNKDILTTTHQVSDLYLKLCTISAVRLFLYSSLIYLLLSRFFIQSAFMFIHCPTLTRLHFMNIMNEGIKAYSTNTVLLLSTSRSKTNSQCVS